jgi:hypothetical protein
MQRQGRVVIGGSTYEIRLKRARGLHPISKIRIILEKVQLTRDDIRYMKKEKNLAFIGCIRFNDDVCSEQYMRIPKKGYLFCITQRCNDLGWVDFDKGRRPIYERC